MFLSSTRRKVRLSADCLSNPQLLVISYAFNCLNACTTRHARFYMNRKFRGGEMREGEGSEGNRREGKRKGREEKGREVIKKDKLN
jgi:hypothetical protein